MRSYVLWECTTQCWATAGGCWSHLQKMKGGGDGLACCYGQISLHIPATLIWRGSVSRIAKEYMESQLTWWGVSDSVVQAEVYEHVDASFDDEIAEGVMEFPISGSVALGRRIYRECGDVWVKVSGNWDALKCVITLYFIKMSCICPQLSIPASL